MTRTEKTLTVLFWLMYTALLVVLMAKACDGGDWTLSEPAAIFVPVEAVVDRNAPPRYSGLDLSPAGAARARIGQAAVPQTLAHSARATGQPPASRVPALPGDTWLVHWTASWCQACPQNYPLYRRLQARGVRVYKIDADNPPAAWRSRMPRVLPTVSVFRGQRTLGTWEGTSVQTQAAIEAAANQ